MRTWCRNLREALTARLEADGLISMYNEIEMPIAPILAEMETAGIGIDGDALKSHIEGICRSR